MEDLLYYFNARRRMLFNAKEKAEVQTIYRLFLRIKIVQFCKDSRGNLFLSLFDTGRDATT